MIENAELVMQMLEMYQMYKQQVPVELEEYLKYVAKTGNTLFQWTLVKPFIREKILNVIAEFAEQSALPDIPPYPNVDPFNYEAMKNILLERFDTFNGPPFTIQRLCELLSCPRKEYNRVDKFMRAVEKNILVVSTCELRSKREEVVVNGVPERWENGKESDINMDLAEKSNVISDTTVLNGNETVESLLNELESMKTPETKIEELKTEPKEDHIVTQVTGDVESDSKPEESTQDSKILTTDTSQTQITDSTKFVEQVERVTVREVLIDLKDLTADELQKLNEIKEVTENSVEDLKDLSNDINLENIEPKTEEPIVESNKLESLELIPTDADRVEGSIIHQTPDSDNKVELDIVNIASTQAEVVLEKLKESVESMDVQVEDVTKTMEPEVNCDNVQKECTESIEIENDKQQNDKPTVDVPAIDTISTEMDVEPEPEPEPEKIEDHITPKETVSTNEETITTDPNTIIEKPQEEDENKLTESE